MGDFSKQIGDGSNGQLRPSATEQSRTIDLACKLFDELKAKGLIDAPRYRLSPLDSVPPRSFRHGPRR